MTECHLALNTLVVMYLVTDANTISRALAKGRLSAAAHLLNGPQCPRMCSPAARLTWMVKLSDPTPPKLLADTVYKSVLPCRPPPASLTATPRQLAAPLPRTESRCASDQHLEQPGATCISSLHGSLVAAPEQAHGKQCGMRGSPSVPSHACLPAAAVATPCRPAHNHACRGCQTATHGRTS